ncbi:cobaltochelatase CobT-related protein [Prauserella flavalba]|uniref:Cobalt chelatase n=1 Tax=Prauserella flavalba TaxID=1477506 RepID=A0A318LPC1_9PSEU|nr:cobalt chelatase [Prauserella flavalba]PXY36241.1 cobalt chelatase [Prauserella flavalba]
MRAERERRRAEELCAAAARALTGEPGLHFRGGRLHDGRRPVPLYAPHLRQAGEPWRGAADGMALHLLRTDRELHRRLRPESGVERLLFELLEQFRAEAHVPATWPGARRNLRERFERWSLAYHHDGHTESARGLLLYTVTQVCRARITGEPVLAETEDLIEPTRAAIAPALGADLAGLRRTRHDQAAFARHARSLAAEVAAMLTSDDTEDPAEERADERDSPLALLLDFDDEPGDGAAVALRDRAVGDENAGYRVFTTAYDREARIATLVRPAALAGYRERLDRAVERQGVNVARLARELEAVLAKQARDGWDGAQEEGLIDGRALARLISSPEERRLFRAERTRPVADVHVTFLIDCSGSMKQHAERVAVLVDLFARALDLLGARSEILGFTTSAWHGGRARKDWLRAGGPPRPGRLNERAHLVFKDAETPWRRARPDIAGLLKADLFREGADGEAVAWAAARARDAGRRALLFVLSDGSPMDGATALANGEHYLDDHLREVVSALEQEGAVEVYGLGVGLDLSPYYRRCLALDTGDGTGYSVFREILGLIAGSRRQ